MNLKIKRMTQKSKYQKFEIVTLSGLRTLLKWIVITIFLLIIIGIVIWKTNYYFNDDNSLIIMLDQNEPLIHTVSKKFLSFGLDSSLLRDMKNLPINEQKFINLAYHLSPAFIRFGGTAADCLLFSKNKSTIGFTIEKQYFLSNNSAIGQVLSNFTLNGDDFLSLYKFTKNSKIRMIFDLNTLLRNVDGSWNSDNAKEIILFAKAHGMKLDWQMGNEPNSFFHVFNISVSAKQLAEDYCKLRSILNDSGYQDSILIGPEANHIGDEKHDGTVYVRNFLENVKDCVNFATWHQYYLDGHIAEVQDFIDPQIFKHLSTQIRTMSESIKSSGKNLSMWISETGSAYGGGAPKLSDRFVAGFLWLDKLGTSAKAGIQTVIRQSLFGGYYAMINSDLEPNPDWWIAVLYKKFVSEKVLNFILPDNLDNVRLYAHCSIQQRSINNSSMITIYGMNLRNRPAKIYIKGLSNRTKNLMYILTSDDLQSRNIYLNNEILKIQDNGKLPEFKPKIVEVNEMHVLPPYSMVFLLVNKDILTCLK